MCMCAQLYDCILSLVRVSVCVYIVTTNPPVLLLIQAVTDGKTERKQIKLVVQMFL